MRLPAFAGLALLAAGTVIGPAHAADDGFETDVSRFSLLLGAGASVQPVYEGSDKYRVAPFPIIAPSFGASDGPRRFEFRSIDDVRVHALYLGPVSFGPLVGYRFGREESDAALLAGLGDVDGGLVVGGFVDYAFVSSDDLRIGADVAVSGQVTGDVFGGTPFQGSSDYGIETNLALSLDRRLSDMWRVSARAGVVLADRDYMRTAFGVSAAQAAASALPAFDPDAGLKNGYVKLAATFNVTERFELRAGAGYSRLVGDAADSPITKSANQFSSYLGAAYRFEF